MGAGAITWIVCLCMTILLGFKKFVKASISRKCEITAAFGDLFVEIREYVSDSFNNSFELGQFYNNLMDRIVVFLNPIEVIFAHDGILLNKENRSFRVDFLGLRGSR